MKPQRTESLMLERALQYAGLGWRVFPCAGKKPLLKGGRGCLDATVDGDQIRAWWSAHPGANIGVHCGAASGIWVLDVDTKPPKGKAPSGYTPISGVDALDLLVATYGVLPPTRIAQTGGGGAHFLWRCPAGLILGNHVGLKITLGDRKLWAALDVREEGGYIVAAPSVHPETQARYAWENEGAWVDAPRWLIDVIQAVGAEASGTQQPMPSLSVVADRRANYASGALRGACDRVRAAPEGKRHDVLRDEAYMVGGFLHLGLSEADARAALLAATTLTGKRRHEAETLVDTGLSQGAAKPRPAPKGGDNPAPTRPLRSVPPPPVETPAPLAAVAELAALVLRVTNEQPEQRRAVFTTGLTSELVQRLAAERKEDLLAGEVELGALAAIRGFGGDATRLRKAVDAQRKALEAAEAAARVSSRRTATPTLRHALGELADDVSEDLQVPAMYAIDHTGVSLVRLAKDGREDHLLICPAPLFIAGLATDAEGAGTSLDLRWYDGKTWRSRLVPRGVALVARSLAELAQHDLPVSSVSAADIVRYLDAYLAHNATRLPVSKTSLTLGWRGDTFLWGNLALTPDGSDASVSLSTEDPGTRQLVAGYRERGSWEGWRAAVAAVTDHPRIMLALLASLVPPLYRFLPDAPNFIVEYAGKTSQGKTTALRLAASVWGCPHDHGEGLIRPWDASQTAIERIAAAASYLPLLLDDTRRAKDIEAVQRIVYGVAQGQGKARGTLTGLQASATWRTVMLSTGEDRLTDLAPAGGAAARVLSLWGSPLDGQSQAHATLARGLATGLLEHHGHAGPRLISLLHRCGHELPARYAAAVEHWSQATGGNAVAERAVSYIALLDVAAGLAADLDIPAPARNPLDCAWEAVCGAASAADLETQALSVAYEWAVSRESSFWGRHLTDRDGDAREPNGGWLGAWKKGDGWIEIAMLPAALEEHLTRRGFRAKTIIRQWADRGWLRVGTSRIAPSVRLLGSNPNCIVITRDGLVASGIVESGTKNFLGGDG